MCIVPAAAAVVVVVLVLVVGVQKLCNYSYLMGFTPTQAPTSNPWLYNTGVFACLDIHLLPHFYSLDDALSRAVGGAWPAVSK